MNIIIVLKNIVPQMTEGIIVPQMTEGNIVPQMNPTHKRVLFAITMLLDLVMGITWRIYGKGWVYWDKAFVIFVFCCHVPFYFALYYENRKALDVLHLTVALSILFGFGAQCISILSIILSFCIGIQLQWIFIDKCILNSEEQNNVNNYGFSKMTTAATLVYSCYLSWKIGRKSTKHGKKRGKKRKKTQQKIHM